MGDSNISEGMLEVFIYESETLLESMEQLAMEHEDVPFDGDAINEMFRSMHTIKGSSAIMMYNNITTTSHKLEDIFYFIRESHPDNVEQSRLVDLVLKVNDFIHGELEKIKLGETADGDETELMAELEEFLNTIKGAGAAKTETKAAPAAEAAKVDAQATSTEKETSGDSAQAQDAQTKEASSETTAGKTQFFVAPDAYPGSKFYIIQVCFKSYVEMQNIKAYTMVFSLKESAEDMFYEPEDIMTNEESSAVIANNGFFIALQTKIDTEEIMATIDHIGGTSNIEINEVTPAEYAAFVSLGSEKYLEAKQRGDTFEAAVTNQAEAQSEEAGADGSEAHAEEVSDANQPQIHLTDAEKAENNVDASASTETPAASSQASPVETEQAAPQVATQDAATAPKSATAQTNTAAPQSTASGNTAAKAATTAKAPAKPQEALKQAFISVNVSKMDALMDLIGELVIAQAVVLQNPDLQVPGLDLTNFQKSASQLQKITGELQDVIMAMRMMPLSNTFQKMKRIVHDVSAKLNKQVELVIIGENTEVDKNIIEHISDPLMHLIRNSLDHGLEDTAERVAAGKPEKGRIVLEAKNEGGKVWISVSDDGKGLNRDKIYKKAMEQGLILDPQREYTDREIYSFITKAGFSTKEQVTEYSGRGVGMDVVVQNIQNIGGSLDIDSAEGKGSKMTLKIPLTLAIIDGIILRVGDIRYVVATGNVKEFLKATQDQIITTPDGSESLMLRGECFPILRLKEYYKLKEGIDNIEDGMITIIEHEGKKAALFIDELIGEQEIVVKPIPKYIKRIKGLSGCTQLGDGSISLILDAGSLIKD